MEGVEREWTECCERVRGELSVFLPCVFFYFIVCFFAIVVVSVTFGIVRPGCYRFFLPEKHDGPGYSGFVYTHAAPCD